MNTEQLTGWVILMSPLLAGVAIYLIKPENIVSRMDRLNAWLAERYGDTKEVASPFARFFTRPLMWCLTRISGWTEGIQDSHARAAVRAVSYTYVTGFAIYLTVMAIVIVLAIVVGVAMMAIVFKMIGAANETTGEDRDAPAGGAKQPLWARKPGGKGAEIMEAGFFGGKVGRVDAEGNIYRGSSWLTEEKVGRVDKDGTLYEGSSWFSEKRSGSVDEDGNVHQGSSWLTERKVGRIDEDGNVHEGTSFLTEKKVGKIEPED